MKNTTVVNLGQVRDLLAEWKMVEDGIKRGRIAGFSVILRGADERETVYVGGCYKMCPEEAMRAALKASAAHELMGAEDPMLRSRQK